MKVKILFTHDIHDRIEPYKTLKEEGIKTIGGMARISSLIEEEKSKKVPSLVLDAGDFSMGTLFQTIYAEEAPNLRMLGKLGYDATTIGNHEFDFRNEGLSQALINAKKSGDRLPSILSSNIGFYRGNEEKRKEEVKNLEQAFRLAGVKEYEIFEKDGIKIGVFGLLGKSAKFDAPMANIEYMDPIASAKKMVKILKSKGADMIICLSHSGTLRDREKSEDRVLARKVQAIDLIISGHTHRQLWTPIKEGRTHIVSCGSYGEILGVANLYKNNENWEISSYHLRRIDDNIVEDINIVSYIDYFKNKVQESYLDKYNLGYDEIISKAPKNFISSAKFGKEFGEDPLGNIISDSYIYSVNRLNDYNDSETIALVPVGTIRDSFIKGDITVSDIFNLNSLGIGEDRLSGYPLLEIYMKGKDIKLIAELDASMAAKVRVMQLHMSGLRYKYNPNRMIFNKIVDIEVLSNDGSYRPLEDKKLYRVIVGFYTIQIILNIKDKLIFNNLLVARDKDGNKIRLKDIDKHIISYKNGELKEWIAIAYYLKNIYSNNKKGEIPLEYYELQGRKECIDDKSFFEIVKNPSIFTIILGFLVLLIILLVFKFIF